MGWHTGATVSCSSPLDSWSSYGWLLISIDINCLVTARVTTTRKMTLAIWLRVLPSEESTMNLVNPVTSVLFILIVSENNLTNNWAFNDVFSSFHDHIVHMWSWKMIQVGVTSLPYLKFSGLESLVIPVLSNDLQIHDLTVGQWEDLSPYSILQILYGCIFLPDWAAVWDRLISETI